MKITPILNKRCPECDMLTLGRLNSCKEDSCKEDSCKEDSCKEDSCKEVCLNSDWLKPCPSRKVVTKVKKSINFQKGCGFIFDK